MEKCKGCIHENVCEHRANIQTDTYAYMGVKYDTEKCEHYMPADVACEVEELIYKLECLLCHATGNRLSKHTYDLRTMESAVTDYVERCCDEARAKEKAEVAREIFEELETKAPWFCENQTAYEHFNEELDELKKKYTEGE